MRGVAVALSLVGLALVVSRSLGLRLERDLIVSVVRALLQLGGVAVVIDFVFSTFALSAVLVILMLVARRRYRRQLH